MSDEINKILALVVPLVAPKVYEDVISPSAKRIGTSLEKIFKIGLSPIELLDYGFEQSKKWLIDLIHNKINETPIEYRNPPSINICINVINSISTNVDFPELQRIYAELLLKSLDSRTKDDIHPSYINVLNQLSHYEVKIFDSLRGNSKYIFEEEITGYYSSKDTVEIQFFKYCKSMIDCTENQCKIWLDNFLRQRLLILESYEEAIYVEPDEDNYSPSVKNLGKRYLSITEYGHGLLNACNINLQ